MGKIIIAPGGGSGISSDELTATLDNVLEGVTVVASDTDDEIGTGTMPDNAGWTGAVERNAQVPIPAGYHDGTGYVAGPAMVDVEARTITPNTQEQIAVAAGQYAKGDVTVAGDPELIPANIKTGTNIFGVVGTYKGLGNAAVGDVRAGKTFSTATLSNATGTLATYTGSTTVTPTAAKQTLATKGKIVDSDITINPYSVVWG